MKVAGLTHSLARALRAGAAPGAGIALSVHGQRWESAAGVANSSTGAPLSSRSRFQLGCITKLLTSLVALELASAGRLDLDAPIGTYLPQLSELRIGRASTSRHLLSHTSGYRGLNIADPAIRYYYGWSKFEAALRADSQLFPSGDVFNYEHTEYVLLGEIVQRIAGEPLQRLFRRMIFDPLDIRCGTVGADAADAQLGVMDHAFDVAGERYTVLRALPYCRFWEASLSDLTLSLSDLVTLGEAIAGFSPQRIFHPDTLEAIRRPCIVLPVPCGGPQHERIPIAFGCGCAQYAQFVFGHNGSARGQTCALRFDVASRVVVAVALNCWRPHIRDMLCDKVLAAIAGDGPEARHGAGLPRPFTHLAGRYAGAFNTCVDVRVTESLLELTLRAGSSLPPVARITLCPGRDGGVEVRSDEAPHLTVGFFSPSPAAARPALLVGLNAYCWEAPL